MKHLTAYNKSLVGTLHRCAVLAPQLIRKLLVIKIGVQMNLNKELVSIVVCVFILTACGGSIVKEVPPKPDTSGKYIFYLHGSVEESEGSTEKYKSAINAIASSSAIVISEVRGDTDPVIYAEKVKEQVNMLISKGVPPKNITISGFSKGAVIALASAGAIENTEVNYVFLAGCSDDLNSKYGIDPAKAVGREKGTEGFIFNHHACWSILNPSVPFYLP
jgi:hypothetical protein